MVFRSLIVAMHGEYWNQPQFVIRMIHANGKFYSYQTFRFSKQEATTY